MCVKLKWFYYIIMVNGLSVKVKKNVRILFKMNIIVIFFNECFINWM